MLFFPLGSAFTDGPAKLTKDPVISKVAEKRGATTSQVALAWLLSRYERILLIPGTTSVAHLEENLASIDIELDQDDLGELEAVEQGAPWGEAVALEPSAQRLGLTARYLGVQDDIKVR